MARSTRFVAALLVAGVIALPAATRSAGGPSGPAAGPPASQPALGQITGRIAPADIVKSVRCVNRAGNMDYAAGWDAAAGRFAVRNLAPGMRYDLEVATTDGRTFIGVDLSWAEDRLARLAREDGEPEEPPGELTGQDRAAIGEIVTKVDMFENERRIMHLQGDHARATALVELRRTTPFHSSGPDDQIRRVELWYFKFQHGGWEKIANAEKVLSRVRAGRDRIARLIATQVYLPQLGGVLVDKANLAPTVNVTLPGYAPTSQPATAPES